MYADLRNKRGWNRRLVIGLSLSMAVLSSGLITAANKWHYDLYLPDKQSGRHVGKTEGDVSYKPADIPNTPTRRIDNCYTARVSGSVKDTAVDGHSIKVYFVGKNCLNSLQAVEREVGFAGKPEDPPDKYVFQLDKVRDATVKICTWTQKRGNINCRCAGNKPCPKTIPVFSD
jgi:hypothetical protein